MYIFYAVARPKPQISYAAPVAGQIIKMINRQVADGLRLGEPDADGHMSAPGLFQPQPAPAQKHFGNQEFRKALHIRGACEERVDLRWERLD